MAKSRGGTRPTGPNAKTQGKALPSKATPANAGPVDTPHSNGTWDAGYCNDCASTKVAPVRGSRKSF